MEQDVLIMEKDDPVNHPSHYNMYPIEVKEIIRLVVNHAVENDLIKTGYDAYCFGSILKYRLRAGLKDLSKTVEDIEKANFYLDDMEVE